MPSTSSRRRLVALLAALALSVTLAACGSDDSDDAAGGQTTAAAVDDGVAVARASIEEASQSPEFFAPPAFDPAPARGKTVWWIGDQSSDIIKQWTRSAKEAFASQGVSLKVYDPGNTAAEHIKGIDLAIAGDADAIILGDGNSPVQFAAQVKKAKDAGIPFFSLVAGTPEFQPEVDGLVLDVSYDYVAVGRLLADWFIADSNGTGNVLLIESPDIPSSTLELNGFRERVKELAPQAKVTTKKYSLTAYADGGAKEVAKITQTELTKDPSIGYVIPAFDSVALQAETGVALAQAQNRVKLAGFNSIVPQMQALQRGDGPFQMDIGGVNEWLAYALADNVLRELSGVPVVRDPKVGVRVFTHENVQDLNVDRENDEQWYGFDYPAEYPGKIWVTK
ncbi:MAG: sugar ABC transporter substrate-binding protein [Thermoleophilia bacterium]